MSSIIEIKDLSFAYGKIDVLQNVCLSIGKNETILLTGPNGGGKTTLLKLICGMLRVKNGKINIKGKISYAPQKLIPPKSMPITAGDLLAYHEKNHPLYKDLYEAFEIDSFKKLQLTDLSGGQLQKINLCNAIRLNYDAILLDEPEQNLDFESQGKFSQILKNFQNHSTLVIISHDIHAFKNWNCKIVCINKTLHCDGNFSQVHKTHCNSDCN